MNFEKSDSLVYQILNNKDPLVDEVINNPDKYYFQLIYTKIDKKQHKYTTFKINEGKKYFYPASLIKFPLAIVALEKLSKLKEHGFSIYDSISLNTCSCDFASNLYVNKHKNPTISQFLREMMIMSNNDAYNLFFDIVGRDEFNNRMQELNLTGILLKNRFTSGCGESKNNISGGIVFIKNGDTATFLNCIESKQDCKIDSSYPITAYKNSKKNGVFMKNEPKNYSYTNYVSLIQVHDLLVDLMNNGLYKNFKLNIDTSLKNEFIKSMGDFPRELANSNYDTATLADYYYKFFIDPKTMETQTGSLRIYNKVGLASGFISDVSYFVDKINGIEFALSAAILSKKSDYIDDGKYNYNDFGIPVLRKIGSLIYQYELEKAKQNN